MILRGIIIFIAFVTIWGLDIKVNSIKEDNDKIVAALEKLNSTLNEIKKIQTLVIKKLQM